MILFTDIIHSELVNSIEPAYKDWFLEPIWIIIWLTIILIIVGIITIIIMCRVRKGNDKAQEFPFDIIEPNNFAAYLEKLQLLTETKNKYINRVKKQIQSPEKSQSSRRRIIIFGRASIGKTREAFEIIKSELLTGSDPGLILMPATAAIIPKKFTDEQIPPAFINKSMVLFYDDLPNIYPSTSEKKEAKLATPQDRLQKVIECCEGKANQFHFIATARYELRDKLVNFDYKKDSFWNTFEIYEVSNLDEKSEFEMIKELIKLYDIRIDKTAIQRIQEINRGYSCEGIVTFLKNRVKKEISIEEISNNFKREAAESWRKSTFEVLQRQRPEIEDIYKVFRFLRYQLNSAILRSTVVILGASLLKKRKRGIFQSGKKMTLRALAFLEERNSISLLNDVITIPDYQLEQFPDLDIEEQIKTLVRKVKKMSNKERSAIASSLFNLGLFNIFAGATEDSLEKFEQVLIFNPKHVAVFNNRGVICEYQGELDKAIENFSKAIEIDPNYATAFFNRGNDYVRIGELDRAIRDYSKAIQLDPKDAKAFSGRGAAYTDKGDLDQAIDDYNKAIQLDPKNADAYQNRGAAYDHKGRPDRAIDDYNKAIELNPKDAMTFCNRGIAYDHKGRPDRAIDDYSKAIELNPKDAMTFCNRGIAFADKGDLDDAIKDLNKAIELNPKYTLAMAKLGYIHSTKRNKEKAKYWYKQALKYRDQLPDKGDRVVRWLKELEND